MIANLLLADEMNGARPSCWNRPPPREGDWYPIGWRRGKRVLRWHRNPFRDICGTWMGTGIGATPETARYPQANGWDCAGCRLLPAEHGGTV